MARWLRNHISLVLVGFLAWSCAPQSRKSQGETHFKIKKPGLQSKSNALSTQSVLSSELCYAFNITGARVPYFEEPEPVCSTNYGIGHMEGSYTLGELQSGAVEFMVKIGSKRFELIGLFSPFDDGHCGAIELYRETDPVTGDVYSGARMDGVDVVAAPIIFAEGNANITPGVNNVELLLVNADASIAYWPFSYGKPWFAADFPNASLACYDDGLEPDAVTLTSNDKIVAAEINLSYPSHSFSPASLSAFSPFTSATTMSSVGGVGIVGFTGPSQTPGSTSTAFGSLADTWNAFVVTFSLDITTIFPAEATPACSFLGVYSSANCTVGSTTINAADLVGGPIQVRAFPANGLESEYLDSVPYASYRYAIRQISNTESGGDDSPLYLSELYGSIYFSAVTGGYTKLFEYYPYGDQVKQISDIATGPAYDDNPGYLTVFFDGRLYFKAYNGAGDSHVYRYDGYNLDQFMAIGVSDNISAIASDSNALYLTADLGGPTGQLGAFDGSTLYKSGVGAQIIAQVFDIGGISHMAMAVSGISHIHTYDNSSTTLNLLTDTASGPSDLATNPQLTLYNGKIFFRGVIGPNTQLMATDGTATYLVADTGGSPSNAVRDLQLVGDELFFVAVDASNNSHVYSWDDYTQTLTQRSDTAAGGGSTDDYPMQLMSHNGKLYFWAQNNEATPRRKLFELDPATNNFRQITNLSLGGSDTDGGYSQPIWGYGDSVLFYASEDNASTFGLYVFNSVYDSVSLLMACNPSAYGKPLLASDGSFYFRGCVTPTQDKIFRLCDNNMGCTP